MKKNTLVFTALLIASLALMPTYAAAEAPPSMGIVSAAEDTVEQGPPSYPHVVINDDDLVGNAWMNSFPVSITGEKFDGSGTLVDYVITGRKHFHTIVSMEGNVFYLIIDYDKEKNNVYFLTEVDQQSLLAMEGEKREIVDEPVQAAINVQPISLPLQQPQQQSQSEPGGEQPKKQSVNAEGGQSSTMLIFIAAVFAIGTAIAYYVKVYKPKRTLRKGHVESGRSDDDADKDEAMFEYADEDEYPEDDEHEDDLM